MGQAAYGLESYGPGWAASKILSKMSCVVGWRCREVGGWHPTRHVTGDTLQMFKISGQRSMSQRKVMYQQQIRYNTAMDTFSNFKLGMALYLKQKDWRGIGRPQVAMHV